MAILRTKKKTVKKAKHIPKPQSGKAGKVAPVRNSKPADHFINPQITYGAVSPITEDNTPYPASPQVAGGGAVKAPVQFNAPGSAPGAALSPSPAPNFPAQEGINTPVKEFPTGGYEDPTPTIYTAVPGGTGTGGTATDETGLSGGTLNAAAPVADNKKMWLWIVLAIIAAGIVYYYSKKKS